MHETIGKMFAIFKYCRNGIPFFLVGILPGFVEEPFFNQGSEG
jgi:hypothetical protein